MLVSKKLSFVLVFVLLVSMLMPGMVAFADYKDQKVEATEEVVKEIAVVEGLSIYQYEDGRIKGVTNQNLSEGQLKRILSEMGFTTDDINKMPSELQQVIVKGGGKKVEPTLLEWTREIHDPNGQVVKEVIYDGNEYLTNIDIMSSQSVPDLDLFYVYRTKTSTHADYDYYAHYNWEIGSPMVGYKDINAIAWDSATRFLNISTYVAKYKLNAAASWQDAWKQPQHEVSGTALHFDCITQPYGQYGYIIERVRVPRYTTSNCIQKYAHKTTPGTLNVSIGPLSISFGGSGYTEDTKRFALSVD